MSASLVPPNDTATERVVLSDMLVHPDNVPVVRCYLTPASFFSPEHKLLCEAIFELDDERVAIDAATVAARVRSKGTMSSHALRALVESIDASPAIANVEAHARILRDLERRRMAIDLCHRKAADGYSDVGNTQTWLESMAGDFAKLMCDGAYEGAVSAMQAVSDTQARRDEAGRRLSSGEGLMTMLLELDDATGGMHRGEVTMVTARSGGGKSAFCCHMALMAAACQPDHDGVARNGGLMFSLEMPREDVVDRWTCSVAKVPFGALRSRSGLTAEQHDSMVRAFGAISRLPLYIDDRGNKRSISFDAIRAETMRQRALLARDGKRLSIVIIDYAQLVDWRSAAGPRGSKYDGFDEIGKRVRELAAEADVAILFPAQLNSTGEIRDCPSFKMHAHNWWDIDSGEPDDYGTREVTLRIRKQRHGPERDVKFWFHGPFLTFNDKPSSGIGSRYDGDDGGHYEF
jgi:replicative DNA helicase